MARSNVDTYLPRIAFLLVLQSVFVVTAEQRIFVAGGNSNNIISFSIDGTDPQPHATIGASGMQNPQAFLFGPDGKLVISEWGNSSVQEFDPETALFERTIVANGTNGLNLPHGIVLSPNGTLLVASFLSDQILEFGLDGSFVRTFAENIAELDGPTTLVLANNGDLIVANVDSNLLLILNQTTGALVRIIGSDDPKTPQDESGGLDMPTGIFVAANGNVIVSSRNTNSVLRFDVNTGNYLSDVIGANVGGLLQPNGICRLPNDRWLVASQGTNNIKQYTSNGSYVGDFIAPFAGGIAGPRQLMLVGDETTLLGDLNCDGAVSVSDIGGFVLALTNPAGYAQQFPNCDIANADVNNDGQVTVSDIGSFVALLTG